MKRKMNGIQLGKYALGDQILEDASYDSLSSLGEIQAKNSQFQDLSILGTAKLENCEITKCNVLGTASIRGGKVDLLEVTGELKLQGQVQCGGIRVLGSIDSEDTSCCILKYGSTRFLTQKRHRPMLFGTYRGESLESFFPLRLDHNQQFKNIFNCGGITSILPIECDRFFSFNRVSAVEINADMCYLYPRSHIKIKELHGGVIIVDTAFDKRWLNGIKMDVEAKDLMSMEVSGMVVIDVIEGDDVVIDHCICKRVSGKNVVIGAHAEIDCVEYHDRCDIHKQAKVKEIIKL